MLKTASDRTDKVRGNFSHQPSSPREQLLDVHVVSVTAPTVCPSLPPAVISDHFLCPEEAEVLCQPIRKVIWVIRLI